MYAFLAFYLALACIEIDVDESSHLRVPCVVSWLMLVFNDKSVGSQETTYLRKGLDVW